MIFRGSDRGRVDQLIFWMIVVAVLLFCAVAVGVLMV